MEKRCVKEKQRNSEERSKINDLPDPLLCHILSYLSTKDSVRSSLLSKRWRSLWLQVPVFDLDSTLFHGDVFSFMEFVDRFLEYDEDLDLNRFKLICSYEDTGYDTDYTFVDSCMDTLVRRRVRDLDVQVESNIDNELVYLPLSLYSCNTLVNLSLYHVGLTELEPESVVSLPCLKVMHLDKVRYSEPSYDESILQRLITCCPVLEELSIIRDPFESLELICVRSESLKSITLRINGYGVVDHAVEIDAPRLKHMILRDHVSGSIIIHSIAPSAVVHINVNFGVEHDHTLDQDFDVEHGNTLDQDDDDDSSKRTMIRNFLTGISTVSGMEISSATLEVIHDYSKLELLPQFSNLSWLYASFLESSLELLPTFLGRCPNLHTLVLVYKFVRKTEPIELSYVPPCFGSSLKFVQIWTPVTRTRTSSQMTLARYFLSHCAVLRKLSLSESFGDIIKEIKKIQIMSIRCNIVID